MSKPHIFKYNAGTELTKDFGWQMYDTPFRSYDPQLGRFHQIDPLADVSPSINPYRYGFNNPISLNDPTGLYETMPDLINDLWERTTGEVGVFRNIDGFFERDPFAESEIENIVDFLDEWKLDSHAALGMQDSKSMRDVAGEIIKGGVRKFIEYVQNPNYGTKFFLNSISKFETRNSNAIPGAVGYSLRVAGWGHEYFPNVLNADELRHIIASFLMAEKYGPAEALALTSGNEYWGFIRNDIPDFFKGVRNGEAYEMKDFSNNKQGILLWRYYDWWRKGQIKSIFKDG